MIQQRRRKELVLITGVHGFVGQHVVRLFIDESKHDLVLTAREAETLFADINEEPRVHAYYQMDVTNRNQVREVIQAVRPDVIVNCAGFVKVDEAEINREQCWKANVSAVEHLCEAARKVDARIVHLSSDYVFDGTKAPYTETDPPHPVNYYGRTKLASENVLKTSGIDHTIIRTSFIYGAAQHANANFALYLLHANQAGEVIEAPTDLAAAPTLVDDLALAIVRIAERRRFGLYNVAGPEIMSRYEFAIKVAETFDLNTELIMPIAYADLLKKQREKGPKADRPMRTGLISLKAQTDLSLHISNVTEGLQVMQRGINDLTGPAQHFIYE